MRPLATSPTTTPRYAQRITLAGMMGSAMPIAFPISGPKTNITPPTNQMGMAESTTAAKRRKRRGGQRSCSGLPREMPVPCDCVRVKSPLSTTPTRSARSASPMMPPIR